jgi:ketosteroid isomerase-like protein
VAAEDPEQLVRRAYEAWNTSGPDALMPFVTDDIELRDAPELPDAATWRGRDAVLGRLEDVAEAVGGHSGELESFRAAGGQVMVAMTWRRDSDAEGEASLGRVFHVARVEGARIARITVFLELTAAERELWRSPTEGWS